MGPGGPWKVRIKMCKKKVVNENAFVDQHFSTTVTHSETLTQAVITTVVIILFLILSYYTMRYLCIKKFPDRESRQGGGVIRRMSRRWIDHNDGVEPAVRYIQPIQPVQAAQPMAAVGVAAMAPAGVPIIAPAMAPANPAPENRARNV